MKYLLLLMLFLLVWGPASAQQESAYQKRALEAAEIDFLSSYYQQQGDNAAVTGGIGTESLTDGTATVIVAIPLNDNDVLGVEAGISAYTSASSSNVNPFDGPQEADPFTASSGASGGDLWSNAIISYTHNSEDRNRIWSANLSVATEYDYFSIGLGGSYSWLFNERNTEASLRANLYFDNWNTIYPIELRPFAPGGFGLNDALFLPGPITGNPDYNPSFTPFSDTGRNTYSMSMGFSQILSKRLQGSLVLDLVYQQGLLSTPFQRVYFADIEDSFLEGFHLADDIERLPDARMKVAVGGRLNYFVNASLSLRSFYRYYADDWDVRSHTATFEVPVKLGDFVTVYPSYRFYFQSAAAAFQPYNGHLSAADYYTSDFDLSKYRSNQFGLGASYTDIFTRLNILGFGLKRIDLKGYHYSRDSSFSSFIITAGFNFVLN